MDDLVLTVKFSLKAKLKRPSTADRVAKTNSIKIFDTTITVEDVGIITLDDTAQTILNCTVGEEITYRKPWAKINKNLIQKNLESEETPDDYQPFIPYKNYISEYPGDDLLLVYAVDELREHDEFYLCLTSKEHESVFAAIQRMEKEQNYRINNSVNKAVRPWKSLGSEGEVDVNIPTTSRGLYTVELYTKYPSREQTHLRLERAESKKFNYTDLTVSEKYKKAIVRKSRTDAEVQTKPARGSKEVQTTYKYPRNVWTQYEYNYAPVDDVSDTFLDGFERKRGELSGEMLVNSNLNLYTDDYACLSDKKSSEPGDLVSRKEYMSVIDVRSNGKMVTAFVWHPLLSGTIAAAYGYKSPRLSVRCDEGVKDETVYQEYWVLIWNINDTFHPKLMLECDSEVQCLSFCPHSENTLIGGCANGQIFHWDLKGKLELESERKLTLKQICHRNRIYGIMQWPAQMANIPIIPPAGQSEMLKSHRGNVTGLNWVHPRYSIAEEGKCALEEESTSCNQQFFTSGSDGSLKFWDLRKASYPEDAPTSRKLPKNKKGVLRLIFTKRFIIPEYRFPCPLRWITQPRFDVDYEEIPVKSNNCFEVIKRKPVSSTKPDFTQELLAGSYLGDFVVGSWYQETLDDDGFETPVVNNDVNVLKISRYHDGPVNSIEQHPKLPDVYLTAGGKVVAIWKLPDTSKPIFWRRSRCNYTHAHWSKYQATGFRVNRADGNREIWDLSVKSNQYHYQIEYTGKPLLQAAVHNFNIKNNLLALSDDQGSLRLVYIPDDIINTPDNTPKMKQILDNNIQVKTTTSTWQKQWIAKYASHLIDEENRLKLERARMEKKAHKERLRMKEKLARDAEQRARLEELKRRPPPGKRAEWAHEKWIDREHKTLTGIVMEKKKLDRDTLNEQRKPVQIARNERIRLSIKKREVSMVSGAGFGRTVAAKFPVVAGERESGKADAEDANKEDLTKGYMRAYEGIRLECEKFIHEHPYTSRINWEDALKDLRMKKKDFDCARVNGRRFRFKKDHVFN